jgi:hypothetical protein
MDKPGKPCRSAWLVPFPARWVIGKGCGDLEPHRQSRRHPPPPDSPSLEADVLCPEVIESLEQTQQVLNTILDLFSRDQGKARAKER